MKIGIFDFMRQFIGLFILGPNSISPIFILIDDDDAIHFAHEIEVENPILLLDHAGFWALAQNFEITQLGIRNANEIARSALYSAIESWVHES